MQGQARLPRAIDDPGPPSTGLVLVKPSHFLQPWADRRVKGNPGHFHPTAYKPVPALQAAVRALQGRLYDVLVCPTRLGRVVLIVNINDDHWVRASHSCTDHSGAGFPPD